MASLWTNQRRGFSWRAFGHRSQWENEETDATLSDSDLHQWNRAAGGCGRDIASDASVIDGSGSQWEEAAEVIPGGFWR